MIGRGGGWIIVAPVITSSTAVVIASSVPIPIIAAAAVAPNAPCCTITVLSLPLPPRLAVRPVASTLHVDQNDRNLMR